MVLEMKCWHKASGGNDAAVKAPPINSKFPRQGPNGTKSIDPLSDGTAEDTNSPNWYLPVPKRKEPVHSDHGLHCRLQDVCE
jgi:hypothetical protein